jgi:predicted CXXCH cytochrome family protein
MGIRVEDPTNPDRFLGCLSCHQPHGTPFRSFLLADPRRDLCVRCHADGQHDTAAGPVGDSQ